MSSSALDASEFQISRRVPACRPPWEDGFVRTAQDEIESGFAAIARGEWTDARSAFERALVQGEDAAALEGLGLAAAWLDDIATIYTAFHQAFRLYQDSGDRLGAARAARALGMEHLYAGEPAVASGWLQRAHRLLDGVDRCPEAGWLSIADAHYALMVDRDVAACAESSATAAALGRELSELDLQMVGLAYRGLALVSFGNVVEGMRLLDEATTAAVAGEIADPDASATCCCCLVYACERVCDYARAAQWCQQLKEMADRTRFELMRLVCRTHYAGVLLWRGQWPEAEAELETAIAALTATRPGEAAEAVVKLAELRCRQGRFDESAALFERLDSDPLRAQGGIISMTGRAELALELGNGTAAADLAERYLRNFGTESRLERCRGLELSIRARSAIRDDAGAHSAATELSAIVADVGTEPLRASCCLAAAEIASAQGDHDRARQCFEDAVGHYERSGGVYAAARARLRLAETLAALDRSGDAAVESQAAYRLLQELGASHGASLAAGLLRTLAGSVAVRVELGGAHLTPREVEILQLLARGSTNQAIAGQLVLSVRTVERHIGNIYEKLGVRGGAARASATAFALSHGIC
jgi:LuxR family maltose regulon positive regulatory protein